MDTPGVRGEDSTTPRVEDGDDQKAVHARVPSDSLAIGRLLILGPTWKVPLHGTIAARAGAESFGSPDSYPIASL